MSIDRDSNLNVKVLFKGRNDRHEAYFMSAATYHAIPLCTPASVQDYLRFGNLQAAKTTEFCGPDKAAVLMEAPTQ